MDINLTLPGPTQIRQSSKVTSSEPVSRVNPDSDSGSQSGGEDQTESPAVVSAGLEDAVDAINYQFQQMQRALEFTIDESSGRTIITVMDRETHEIIRQIPPEETLAIASRLQMATGAVLVDDSA